MMATKRARTKNGTHDAGNKEYKVLVSTNGLHVSSFSLTLLDSNNQSSKKFDMKKNVFGFGKDICFNISAKKDLEDIIQVKLEKDSKPVWFCKQIRVKSPSGKYFEFPCYGWLEGNEVIIREGSARLPQEDTGLLKKQRQDELESRQKTIRWTSWRPGFPQIISTDKDQLPLDLQFHTKKSHDFTWNVTKVIAIDVLDFFKGLVQPWDEVVDFKKIEKDYDLKKTLIENVMQKWNTDYMFGYQFLNGCNPVVIRKCVKLPDKFPVTHEMVKSFLQRGLTLEQELMAGNIYITDYEILEGLKPNKTSKKIQYYLTAPICLLYNNRLNQIVPIAIQLTQEPGETSPIFLPNDNEYDWMLAKMWVKSSDFNVHQLVTHLLKTHLISEVFEVAMYRQLSKAHPVFKLLVPHVRFTVAINTEARKTLISEHGVFSKISSISGDGIQELIKRAMETLTYKSLCFPDTIKNRGMEDAPKYYYRDDGMRVWEAINGFVSEVIEIYYISNKTVQKDVEIQEFVKDVCVFGMCNSKGDKFPQSLETREELTQYLTAVIFTASAQHAAVNFGQFDWYSWIPNSPSTMRTLPPKQKGTVDLDYIMDTLPDRGCSDVVLGTVWGLSRFQKNERFLGMYPDMYFTEQPMKEAFKTFRKKLDELTESIKRRNEGLTMDYCYLSPNQIPNSVAI